MILLPFLPEDHILLRHGERFKWGRVLPLEFVRDAVNVLCSNDSSTVNNGTTNSNNSSTSSTSDSNYTVAVSQSNSVIQYGSYITT